MSLPKIGLVCPYDLTRGGGVQEHILAQYRVLKAGGYKVKILTPKPRNGGPNSSKDTIYVGTSRNIKTPISTSLELGISERKFIDQLLQAEKFDILHVHEPEVPVLGAQIIARAECPIVATFHAYHPPTARAKTIEALRVPYSRTIFSKLDAMTAVSDIAAEFARNQSGREVQIIPNGIELSEIKSPKNVSRDPNMILYVGRLERRKGVRDLILAFGQIQTKYPELKLMLAGDGPEATRLKNLTNNHGIPNVSFLGYVSDSDKKKLFNQASVFCSPALFGESFGIVLLEAMAYGVPIVAGNNPGYEGVMQGLGAISIVNPDDTYEFARRLELFLSQPKLRQVWQAWAKDYVKQFDYKLVVNKYESIYRGLTKR